MSELPLFVQVTAALGPLLLLGGALTAAFLVWNAGRRDRWWVRAQWAMGRAHGKTDSEQAVGLGVLRALWGRAPSKDERLIVREIASLFLDRFSTLGDGTEPAIEYQLADESDEEGGDEHEG